MRRAPAILLRVALVLAGMLIAALGAELALRATNSLPEIDNPLHSFHESDAVLGWRGGTLPEDTAYNGFYVSSTGGAAGSWQRVKTPGIQGAIGRVSLDYSPGGATLWAIIESSETLTLNGVYRSDKGTADGGPDGAPKEQVEIESVTAE